MQVKFKLLREGARLPERGHGIDVGLDTFTPTSGILKPGINKIPLGFSCDVPVGYGAFIYPRTGMTSGEASKYLLVSAAGAPTTVGELTTDGVSIIAHMPPIDPGYTGEVHALVTNSSMYFIKYKQHTRFGQLVFYPIAYVTPVEEVDTTRGDGAFASTGIAGLGLPRKG